MCRLAPCNDFLTGIKILLFAIALYSHLACFVVLYDKPVWNTIFCNTLGNKSGMINNSFQSYTGFLKYNWKKIKNIFIFFLFSILSTDKKIKLCWLFNENTKTYLILKEPSWSWSYSGWIYNYLCNQCLSLLKLWFESHSWRILPKVLDTTLCDKVGQLLSTGRWFSQGNPVCSTNNWQSQYNWNIVESAVKHDSPLTPNIVYFSAISYFGL